MIHNRYRSVGPGPGAPSPAGTPRSLKVARSPTKAIGSVLVYLMVWAALGCSSSSVELPPTPTPNPNMSRIAFVSARDGNWEIYLMNADGSDKRNITNNPALDGHPSWSPDGSRLAFYSDRDGDRDIYVVDSDGSNLIQLTDDPGADHSPAWSPDGTKVAFISDRDGRSTLWVMDAKGSNQVNLTPRLKSARWPAWSPDSSRIAIVTDKNLYYVNPDGSFLARIIGANDFVLEGFFLGWPAWSPDGLKLALVSNFKDRDGLLVGTVYTADSEDGFNFRPVYYDDRGWLDPDLVQPADNPVEYDERPTWSPNGKMIAYASFTEEGDRDIWVVDFETKVFARLTDDASMDSFPVWERSGVVPEYPFESSTTTPIRGP